MNGQKLEQETSFKNLGAILCKDSTSSAEVRIWIASVLAAMAGLNGFWRCNTISFASTLKPYKSLVTAILLHGREAWTLLDDFEKKRRGPCFRNQVPEETSPQVLLVA